MYNGYPQYNPYMMNQYRQMNSFDSLQFVNGKESAENYIMPPNSKVILMDQNIPRFYLKETDATGMAKITAYDFTEAVDKPIQNDYITREEFNEWRSQYESSVSKQTKSNESAVFEEPIDTRF
ncbi:MAG: hypothetical protein EGR23_06360 [Holdemanella biformis]|nr:hypothetical protein [Holdemanella biformis]